MNVPNGGRQENGAGNGTGQGSAQQELEYELLGEIAVLSFTANPDVVELFRTTTLSWSVRLPPALVAPVSFTVVGEGPVVTNPGISGSATATPLSNSDYALIAETAIVNRQIATVSVRVDTPDCRPQGFPAAAITNLVQATITRLFQGDSNEFSLARSGVIVNSSNDTIFINVPLNLNIPNWFDATMDIAVQIGVGMQGAPPQATVSAWLRNVHVNVDWSWYSDVLSGGCTVAVAAGMEKVSQAFIRLIAQNSATGIAEELNRLVQVTAAIDRAQDTPERRTYTLTSLDLTSTTLDMTLCPLPASGSNG
jgi:hypothetical protein